MPRCSVTYEKLVKKMKNEELFLSADILNIFM